MPKDAKAIIAETRESKKMASTAKTYNQLINNTLQNSILYKGKMNIKLRIRKR